MLVLTNPLGWKCKFWSESSSTFILYSLNNTQDPSLLSVSKSFGGLTSLNIFNYDCFQESLIAWIVVLVSERMVNLSASVPLCLLAKIAVS